MRTDNDLGIKDLIFIKQCKIVKQRTPRFLHSSYTIIWGSQILMNSILINLYLYGHVTTFMEQCVLIQS